MVLPGPSGAAWAFALLGYAALLGLGGEALRYVFERRVSFFRPPDWIERAVVDLYLGVGAVYLVAALPFSLFYPATPLVLTAALVAIAFVVFLRRRRRGIPSSVGPGAFSWPQALAVAGALVLFGIETAYALSASAGNTYDASLFALYSGLLSTGHSLAWNLSPVVAVANPYPQGATAVFGAANGLFQLPPPRSSLMVTPLFFSLAPLGGYVWGRRWLGSPEAGAAFAVMIAIVATWTRTLAAGSNDFVLAFPLLLLLLGWATRWWEKDLIDLPNTVAFGGLLAIAAVLSPVGPIWLMLTILLGACLFRPRFSGQVRSWVARWGVALGTGLVLLLPSLVALVVGPSAQSAGYAPVATGPPMSLTATFVGYVNPFLFGPNDDLLSPFPLLRVELAFLLIAGVVLLVMGRRLHIDETVQRRFGLAALAAVVIAIAELAFEVYSGAYGATMIRGLTSPAEIAILLFAVYTAIATYPLVLLLARRPTDPHPAGWARRSALRHRRSAQLRLDRPTGRPSAIALLVAVVLLAPGVAVTATEFPSNLATTYENFGNLTSADFDLLSWSSTHLPGGARVLVAPGSAAQFLPGYNSAIVPIFPVLVVGESTNQSYRLVVDELDNGTLDAAGVHALDVLNVGYVAVTQRNSVLWAPFLPDALLGSPRATIVYHEGDAYLFAWETA